MRDKLLSIINSEFFHYLYERWQDESEYEDIEDYGKAIAEKFSVTVISSKPFEFLIELEDKSRWELTMRDKGDYVVGAYREAASA
jgi:hypothetical protein